MKEKKLYLMKCLNFLRKNCTLKVSYILESSLMRPTTKPSSLPDFFSNPNPPPPPSPHLKKKKKKYCKKFSKYFQNICYTSGKVLTKHKTSYYPYTLEWRLVTVATKKYFITQDDCWFNLPSELSKSKSKIKKILPLFLTKKVSYTCRSISPIPALRKKTWKKANFSNENSFL